MIRLLGAPNEDRLARLSLIHHSAFEGAGRGWTGEEIAALAASGALVADDGDRGFALISIAADEAELLTIAVAPDARRRGLGAGLLGAAEAAARERGGARMLLEVAADNDAAIALYARAGFETIGRRKGYYQREAGRVDALTMAKRLC